MIEVDGTPVNGGADLVAAIRDRQPGDEITIIVLREGETISLTATLIERPPA